MFFCKENFYSDLKNLQKKYSDGIIDTIKMRNIYNTYTYIPIWIQLIINVFCLARISNTRHSEFGF